MYYAHAHKYKGLVFVCMGIIHCNSHAKLEIHSSGYKRTSIALVAL